MAKIELIGKEKADKALVFEADQQRIVRMVKKRLHPFFVIGDEYSLRFVLGAKGKTTGRVFAKSLNEETKTIGLEVILPRRPNQFFILSLSIPPHYELKEIFKNIRMSTP